MNSKKTIPVAALLTLLIIAVLGTIDRWISNGNQPVTSEHQEAAATREKGPALKEGDRTEVASTVVYPIAVDEKPASDRTDSSRGAQEEQGRQSGLWTEGEVSGTSVDEAGSDSTAVEWITVPGTAVPIWPKP